MKLGRIFACAGGLGALLAASGCQEYAGLEVTYVEQIAFTEIADRYMRIVIADPDGSNAVTITEDMQTNLEPTFSPDGSQILFTSWRVGDANIWVMNRDGSGARGLTTDPRNERSARFSPNGFEIAYVVQAAGVYDIYKMHSDGSGTVNLTNSPGTVDIEPRWSPDGSRILFCSTRGSDGGDGDDDEDYSLWVMNADGSGLARLPVEGGARWPAWSPDGSKIAFVSDRTGDSEIWVMNADGTSQVNVSNTPGVDEEPYFSPDGSVILFSSRRTGSPDIWSMGVDGSNQRNLTQSESWVAFPSWSN